MTHRPAALLATLALVTTSAAADGPKRLTVAQRKAFAEALATGRAAVKAKDTKAGIRELEAALVLVPTSPTVMGELGWALFQDGQLDRAARLTADAVYASNRATQLGALLYNRGRIAEAKGNTADARAAYTESLAYRENATVQKRLAGLGGPVEGGESVEAQDTQLEAFLDTVDVYCETAEPAGGKETDGCTWRETGGSELAGGGLASYALITAGGGAEPGGSVDTVGLVVEYGGTFYGMGIVADSYVPGVAYVTNSGSVDADEARDVFPELPGSELVLRTTNGTVDHDPGIERTSSTEHKSLTVCGVLNQKPTCVTVTTSVDDSENELDDNWEAGKQLGGARWSLTSTLADGKITLALDQGARRDLPPGVQACLGTFTFEQLSRKACATTRFGR